MATTTSAAKRSKKSIDSISAGPGGPWSEAAPRRVRESYRSLEDATGWIAWHKHLSKRKFRSLGELLPGKRSPFAWALPAEIESQETAELIAVLDRIERRTARKLDEPLENVAADWLSAVAGAPRSVALGLESLAWCAALPALATHLSARLWWSLVRQLTALASQDITPSQKSGQQSDPLAVQIIEGELPLALAYTLPELEICRTMSATGHETLSEGFAALLDGEGLLHASHLSRQRDFLATWTRCRALASELPDGSWTVAAETQFPPLVQYALRLSRADGRQVFSSDDADTWNGSLLKAALRFAGDRATERVARLCQRGTGQPVRGKQKPAPSFEGEWAGLAVLRPDWLRSSPRLSVDHHGPVVQLELSIGSKCLWSGPWGLDVQLDGQSLSTVGEWEQVCWETDAKVDYLELEIHLGKDVTVQRHVLMARQDGFLLLADAVLSTRPGVIKYRGTLPVEGHSAFRGEAETREGTLVVGRQPRARVLPLALGEWRSSHGPGGLQVDGEGLALTQTANGRSLFAPLFVDLDRSRLRKEATWRPLTVGQTRQIVSTDQAVGYRAQVGKSQWLVYRSLGPPEIRTLLGKNLMHEFLVGRFGKEGDVETLLEIE